MSTPTDQTPNHTSSEPSTSVPQYTSYEVAAEPIDDKVKVAAIAAAIHHAQITQN